MMSQPNPPSPGQLDARRVLGQSSIQTPSGDICGIDLGEFVRRLLLFDTYVMCSVRLREFPFLAQHFGYDGVQELLASGALQVHCECLMFAQTAQSGILGEPILPVLTYKFRFVDASNWDDYFFKCANESGQRRRYPEKWHRLIDSVRMAVRRTSPEVRAQLFPEFLHELVPNAILLKESIRRNLSEAENASLNDFFIVPHRESEDVIRVETDIGRHLGLPLERVHKIVEAGLMGISGLVLTLGHMKNHSAITGFKAGELPLFSRKLGYLASLACSASKEQNFQRVMEISGLAELPNRKGVRIKTDKLLRLRDSAECREFRDWLSGAGSASDAEIRDRVRSWNARLGTLVSGQVGRTLRFLTTFGLGLINLPTGAAASVFDSFLLDRLLPRSGIAAFVGDSYPSLFTVASVDDAHRKNS